MKQPVPKPSGDRLGVCRLGREAPRVRIVEPIRPQKVQEKKRKRGVR